MYTRIYVCIYYIYTHDIRSAASARRNIIGMSIIIIMSIVIIITITISFIYIYI